MWMKFGAWLMLNRVLEAMIPAVLDFHQTGADLDLPVGSPQGTGIGTI